VKGNGTYRAGAQLQLLGTHIERCRKPLMGGTDSLFLQHRIRMGSVVLSSSSSGCGAAVGKLLRVIICAPAPLLAPPVKDT